MFFIVVLKRVPSSPKPKSALKIKMLSFQTQSLFLIANKRRNVKEFATFFRCLLGTCSNINNDGCCVNVLFHFFIFVVIQSSSLFRIVGIYLSRAKKQSKSHFTMRPRIYICTYSIRQKSVWLLYLFVNKFIKDMRVYVRDSSI